MPVWDEHSSLLIKSVKYTKSVNYIGQNLILRPKEIKMLSNRRHDNQHDDTHHNDTQHYIFNSYIHCLMLNVIIPSVVTLKVIMMKCPYVESHYDYI